MKLSGSRMILVECYDCDAISAKFRIYLEGDSQFNSSDWPQGWDIPDEAELFDSVVYGYCPEHKEGR